METTIKQAEDDRNRSLDSAKRLYEDYRPLKDQLDSLRTSVGLDHASGLDEDDPKLTQE